MSKLGLVAEGGGMKCAYEAAILDRLLDDQFAFDYVIGASAGSANLASYLARQRGRNLRFYTDHIHDKDYFGIHSLVHSGDLFGLEYIYQNVSGSNGKDALDFQAFEENPADYEAVATDAITGKPHYFPKELLKKDDCRIIMASCAIPAACRPVKVGARYYYDGGVSDPIPVDRALAKGCEKLVVITSKPRDYVKAPEKLRRVYHARCLRFPRIAEALDQRHLSYAKAQKRMYELETEGTAFVFAPSESYRMGTFDMNEKDNRALYDLGLRDYEARRQELISFLMAGEENDQD